MITDIGGDSRCSLNLAAFGNCSFAALVDMRARVCFACMPQFDSDPIFCSLIDGCFTERGFWEICVEKFEHSTQRYVQNTAIVITSLFDVHGAQVDVVDFAPRYSNFGRVFRPSKIVRIVRPVKGVARVIVKFRPSGCYGNEVCKMTRGANHIVTASSTVENRLTSSIPVSFILGEIPFNLTEEQQLIFGTNESFTSALSDTCHEFLERTKEWWNIFSRSLWLPVEWQDVVIRSAITLKLCQFEESGAIVAALTTSIPEDGEKLGRNWDYRFCWIRDSFFTIRTLNRLSETSTMEGFLRFMLNVVASNSDGQLQPVYGILHEANLQESICNSLAGFRSHKPVRVGNGAYCQVQHDSYGNVILAVALSFLDARLPCVGNLDLFLTLEKFGEKAVDVFDTPDAGLWELRTDSKARCHTYSAVMCWVGCDRLSRVAAIFALEDRVAYWRMHADRMHAAIMMHAWSDELNSFVAAMHCDSKVVDASLLLLEDLKFIEATDPKFISTVTLIGKRLMKNKFIMRYEEADDFGVPSTSFNVCTFWYIDALASIGRIEEARDLFEHIVTKVNHVGLLSEDIDVNTGQLWGNFPQAYSACGLITSCIRLSKQWSEVGL